MAKVIKPSEARKLDLPGRSSLEIVSAINGSSSLTLRLVEVPVPKPGDSPRSFHCHDGFEECIYVLSGQGTARTESAEHSLTAGDTIL
ncbi:MAG: cupin domain-containing protein, partial [Rhodospirillales bacterium]|nr:cupin domain-containing protein [Rhodospirillales bacterium]